MNFKIFDDSFYSRIDVPVGVKCNIPDLIKSVDDIKDFLIIEKTKIYFVNEDENNGVYLSLYPQSGEPIKFRFEKFQEVSLSDSNLEYLRKEVKRDVSLIFTTGSSEVINSESASYKIYRDIKIRKLSKGSLTGVELSYYANIHFSAHPIFSKFKYKEEDLSLVEDGKEKVYLLKEGTTRAII